MSRLSALIPGVLVADAARGDINEILAYIGQHNPERAALFAQSLSQTATTLLAMPSMGSPRHIEGLAAQNLRVWPVKEFKNYLLWYRAATGNDSLEVVRVLHHSRDLFASLFEDNDND